MDRTPKDIIDIILDEFSGDVSTLRTCSLISKSFNVVSHAHLFNHVSLRSRRQCQRFYSILAGNSYIASCVRHFNAEDIVFPTKHWIANVASVLCLIFQMLPHLQTVKLRGSDCACHIFPVAIRSCLLVSFQAPILTSLSLTDLRDIPLDQISQYKHLMSLSLIRCTVMDGEVGPLPRFNAIDALPLNDLGIRSSGKEQHLDSLMIMQMYYYPTINTVSRLLSDPRSSLSISHLHSFGFLASERTALIDAWAIMRNAAASLNSITMHLVSLDLYNVDSAPVPVRPVNLGHLTELRSIHLIHSIGPRQEYGLVFDWLPRFFGSASPESQISSIQLRFEGYVPFEDFRSLCTELDLILSRPAYGSLSEVKVVKVINKSKPEPVSFTTSEIARCLPHLHISGLLIVEFLQQ